MKTTSKQPGNLAKSMGLIGIGLCALCCALPFIGIVGGAGLSIVALYVEKIAIVLLIISAASFAIWHYRKRQAPPACSVDCDCKTANVDSKTMSEVNVK